MFTTSSLPFKKKEMLGLNIGSRSVKMVKISHPDGKEARLDFWGMLELERNSPSFVSSLKQYLGQNHLLGLPTAACINDPSLKIRKIELPDMPSADLKEAIRWKMRDIVDGPIADFSVSFSQIEAPMAGGVKKQVLIGYAIKRSVIFEMTSLLNQLGLKPKIIEPSAVSLAAGIEKIYPSDNLWTAGLDLDSNQPLMVIMGQGKFYFSRPLPGINLEEARQDPSFLMKKLAAEIQNTLDTFSVIFHVEKINRIFLAGEGAELAGLSDYLSKNLAVESSILNPFQGLGHTLTAQKNEKFYLYAQAVSLATI